MTDLSLVGLKIVANETTPNQRTRIVFDGEWVGLLVQQADGTLTRIAVHPTAFRLDEVKGR